MKQTLVLLAVALLGPSICTDAHAFTHPDIPLTTQDLATVKASLNRKPWKTGCFYLVSDGHSSLGCSMQGTFATVIRQIV
jgi:hypothetical protein